MVAGDRPGGGRGAAGKGPGLARPGSGWEAPRELFLPPRDALWRAFFGLKILLKSSSGARKSNGRVNKNNDLPISRGFKIVFFSIFRRPQSSVRVSNY